jgi:PAS domain S-box-containing protein
VADEDLRLLEQLEAGIVVVDPAGLVVYWNGNAERILGLSAAEAVGRPWTESVVLLHGGMSTGREIRAQARRAIGWDGLVRIRIRDGRNVWVRGHLQASQEAGGWSAVFWAADGLAEDSGRGQAVDLPYHELFRVSSEALFLTDLDSVVVDATEAGAAMLGASVTELVGKTLASRVDGWTQADTEAAREEALTGGSLTRAALVTPFSGEPFRAELIATIVSPTPAGFALVRIRDVDRAHKIGEMMRTLGGLARLTEEPEDTREIARQALEMTTAAWHADASVLVVDGPNGFAIVGGPQASETLRATFGGIDPARSDLARYGREKDAPFEIDLEAETPATAWADRVRVLGYRIVRGSPIRFGERYMGVLAHLWNERPPIPFDAPRHEMAGALTGMAVGNADLRTRIHQETELRTTLEGSARIGGAVVAQATDAIVATDRDDKITAVNPAAERLYGFTAAEAIGRHYEEMVDQLRLDGTPLGKKATDDAKAVGYWHDRVIHRPQTGTRAGRHIVVDLSLTAIRDEKHRASGLIAMSREVISSAHLETEAVGLGSLVVATGRARTRHEVAEIAVERLCEATAADAGIIVTWGEGGENTIEASRGLGDQLLAAIRSASVPAIGAALDEPGRIIDVDSFVQMTAGTELVAALQRGAMTTGFLTDLRARDQSIGILALGARRPAWSRPPDEVILNAAAQIAGALENARLMERLEQGLEQERRLTTQLETLMGLTLLPEGEINEEALGRFLLERVTAALGASGGMVVRESNNKLTVTAAQRVDPQMRKLVESQPADAFELWRHLADSSGGVFRVTPDEGSAAGASRKDATARRGVVSYAAFPIRDGDRLVAALMCNFTGPADAPERIDDRTIDAVARIISIAYANVRMSERLAEAADHERRLTGELRALQELTLLGATTDDLAGLARETIDEVVVATGATGGGYILVDPVNARVDPIVWVGSPSRSWSTLSEAPALPGDWPSFEQLQSDEGIWLSQPKKTAATGKRAVSAQAVLPLWVDNRLAGALHLEWATSPRIEQFDVHFLEPIARICSISLANFRLRSELVQRAAAQRALGHRLDTLDELTRIGEEASSFEELAHRTVSLVREALGANGVCYLLIEPGHHFETHAVAGETGAFRQWLKGVPAKDAPGGNILLSGGGSVLGDFVASQVNERVLPLAKETGFRSFGAIPIQTGEELAGALLCFFEQPASNLPLDEAALDSVSQIAGIALANFRLRERLVSSEERYRTLFEESPEAMLVTALDGTVLDANEAAVRLYHVNRGEVLGRYFGQLISADEREMARRRQIVWAQGRGTFDDRGRRPDGSEFPIEVEIRVVELGGQRRFLSLVRDLSDQERLQRELLQAQKMEAIGQLVSGVAHELNNPLAAIIAFSQLMRSDPRLPEDMKHDAGLLVQEADRTRRIVQNLLDFARARPPERRPTNIGTLVKSVLELQSYALSTNKIQVVVDIKDSLPEVDLDRAQLQQVLLNLTINAIQAIRTLERPGPAHMWVGAAIAKPAAALPRAAKGEKGADEQRVRITIRDDGPGVPESARARLFDPFFTTKQPGEGTGLGLSVSFGIVAAHGGHLWYEPGPRNVGSSFIIELPVRAKTTDEQQLAVDPDLQRKAPPSHVVEELPAAAEPVDAATAAPAPRARRAASGRPKGAAADAPQPAPADVPRPSPREIPQIPKPPQAPAAEPPAEPAAQPPAAQPPTAEAPAAPGPQPAAGAAPQVRRPRILALDDEPSIRAFLRKALAAAGMDCTPYQDGAQALEGLRDTSYDVMLIDHRMAGMSGTEFYQAAVDFRPELARRAVFMSGDVLNPDLRGFATQRSIRLLAKPFDIEAVIRVVREALAQAEESEGGGSS